MSLLRRVVDWRIDTGPALHDGVPRDFPGYIVEFYECGHYEYYRFPYEPRSQRMCNECAGRPSETRLGHFCR